MQSQGPRSAIAVILHEHQQMSTVVEGMRRFVHLLAAGTPTPGLMVLRGDALLHPRVPPAGASP